MLFKYIQISIQCNTKNYVQQYQNNNSINLQLHIKMFSSLNT